MELLFYDLEPLLYQKNGESSTPLRTVPCFEIEYQLNDGGTSCIDGKAYPIRGGQLLLAKPGMKRYTSGAYYCLAIHFCCRDHFLTEQLNRLPHTVMPLNPVRAEELLRSAYRFSRNANNQHLRLEGLLLEILAEYMDTLRLETDTLGKYSGYAKGIYQTVEYMQKSYAEHITSEMLAKQMFISTNFYQKIFKQIMGIPPAQFLREIRLSEACRLLSNTDLSMPEIAERCGFSSDSYFIYVVRKYIGVTPLEYRKANRVLL